LATTTPGANCRLILEAGVVAGMPVESDSELAEMLDLETVAVVGCSTSPGKAAHDVPAYLREHGYDVVPVNPYADEVFGREAYDSLSDVEEAVDIVDVFRPSEEVAGIVDEAIERSDVEAVWLQLDITDDEAAARAEDAGLRVVQDRCMKVEHGRLKH
jgi:predicted CoA-binding protein